MRLIDADEMRENLLWCKSQSGRHNDIYWDDVIERLDVQPTVDAAPVKHGRWKKTNNPSYSPFDGSSEHISICSNCAYSREQHDFLYCPNCGAKMVIGAENDGIETEEEADDNR